MLYSVNLLPWREQKRQQHRQRFYQLLILAVLVAGGIQYGFGAFIGEQNTIQQQRLNYLKDYNSRLDKQLSRLKLTEQEHQALLQRLSVVESLQQQRNKSTEFMNAIPAMIPEGVYVDKIKMNTLHVELTGISDSMARLATMLDNLEKSPLLEQVEMHSIVHGKQRFGKKFQTFKVSFSIKPSQLANHREGSHG
ncbi:PilN domain-containing protein [Vibrio paucivorans]